MVKQSTKLATPRLRFPEFRGSEGWSTAKMDRLYSFGRNNILSRDKLNYVDGAAKNIHYGDIHTKFPATFDVSRERVPFVNPSEALPDLASGDYCIEGDLVFADASEDMSDVGKTMEIVRLRGEQVLAGQHTILARQRGGTFVTGFGAYLFGSALMRGRIKKEAQGTKVYQISAARLGGIDVTYPNDKPEQQRIADCLTSLDEVIAAQGRKVAALKAHKRGLMQQIFPREGETRPCLRFPEFRDAPEWRRKSLADLGQFLPALSGKSASDFDCGEAKFIPYSNVFEHTFIDAAALRAVNVSVGERQNKVRKGDVFFTVSSETQADAGMSSVLLEDIADCYLNSFCALFRFSQATVVDSVFAGYFLRSERVRVYLASNAQGAIRYNISRSVFQELPVVLPSFGEQQRIADCLSSLDMQITAGSRQLAALKTHKQGLMQQLFPAPEAATA